jgi:hypothetical protein
MRTLFSEFRFTPAIIALIAMNLIPLVGVLKFGWDAGTIVFLYWLENVIIGLLNIPKILACTGGHGSRPPSKGGLIYLAVFFAFHYGMFCFGHYFFLLSTYRTLPDFGQILPALFSPVLFWSLLGLTLSHIVSMIVNFFGKGEFKSRSPNAQMFIPYSRIVLLHIVIILSGFAALAAGQGVATLVLLVVFKILFDLAAHVIEHSKVESLIAPSVD